MINRMMLSIHSLTEAQIGNEVKLLSIQLGGSMFSVKEKEKKEKKKKGMVDSVLLTRERERHVNLLLGSKRTRPGTHIFCPLSFWIHIGLSPILDGQKKKAFEKKKVHLKGDRKHTYTHTQNRIGGHTQSTFFNFC